jgi:RNA polymerase sigma factor (sigma-70 family)
MNAVAKLGEGAYDRRGVDTVEQDEALWLRWRDGDLGAGDVLFRRHFAAVYRFFTGKGLADVEDLVQRTFMACLEAAHRDREVEHFQAWLFGIARHVLFERWRTRPSFDPSVSSLAAVAPSASVLFGEAQEHDLLARALRRISLDEQILLELHYWEGLTTHQLAIVLEIPHGTAKGQLGRARRSLRRVLTELTEAGALRDSTLANLERWIASMRDQIPASRKQPS